MQLSEQLARTFTSMGRLMNALEGELPRSDFQVLVQLGHETGDAPGARSSDLARSQGLDPSTMSRRVASLVERFGVDLPGIVRGSLEGHAALGADAANCNDARKRMSQGSRRRGRSSFEGALRGTEIKAACADAGV